ncbi:hypothetical protein [Chromobacterium sphagni]|nr:hypothetical protein [Chromobacterium sphagni]
MVVTLGQTGSRSTSVKLKAGIKALAYRENSVASWQGVALSPRLVGQRQGVVLWGRVRPAQWHWQRAFAYDGDFEIRIG